MALADRLGLDLTLAELLVVEELLERLANDQRRALLRLGLGCCLNDIEGRHGGESLQDRRGGLTLGSVRRLVLPCLVVVLALFAAPSAFAAGSITGTVRDDPNGNGAPDEGEGTLPGATVGFDTNGDQALDVTAATGNDGIYAFQNLSPAPTRSCSWCRTDMRAPARPGSRSR